MGKKFWPLEPRERGALEDLFSQPVIKKHILSLHANAAVRDVRFVDAAYWMKGCSSLGLALYAATSLKGTDEHSDYALIDLKEAIKAVAPVARGVAMPKNEGERVVAGARALSSFLGERMIAASFLGKSMLIRELAPQDLKLEVDQFSQPQALKAARYLAHVVGTAHGRQMDDVQRSQWSRTLLDHPAPTSAPLAVVERRQSRREARTGYLEHCRQYALAVAG